MTTALLPYVSQLAEADVRGYDLVICVGRFAPAGTPQDVIARRHGAIERGVAAQEVRGRMIAAGILPVSSTPQQLRETIVSGTRKCRALAGGSRPDANLSVPGVARPHEAIDRYPTGLASPMRANAIPNCRPGIAHDLRAVLRELARPRRTS